MKKKFLLLVLTVCLLFCLTLTTCDEDFKTESVPGLWEKLRNTAWTMRKGDITYTVGFYGPQNGPEPPTDYSSSSGGWIDEFKNKYGLSVSDVYDEYKYPYCVIRIASDSGIYYFEKFTRLQISRTGTISESRSDAYYKYITKQIAEYNGLKEEDIVISKEFMRSFHVSISDNGLTISSVKMGDVYISDEDKDDPVYILKNYITKINGSYSYYRTDPKFKFDEVYQQLWSQIKNTAWTKQGSSTPSIGFYEQSKGPSGYSPYDSSEYWGQYGYDGYMYFKVSVGTVFTIGAFKAKGSGYMYAYNLDHDPAFSSYYGNNLFFRITVSGNTLTISDTELGSIWAKNNDKQRKFYFNGVEYTEEQAGAIFNGTYTMTSNSPTYSW